MAAQEEHALGDAEGLGEAHAWHVAATYKTYEQAEAACRKLIDAGIPARHISLVGKNFTIRERPLGYTTIAGVAKSGSKFGALWGGVLGLLWGFTLLFSGAGPLVVFGPIAYAVVSAVEGAVFGGLAGVLIGWGLQREKALQFEQSVETGEFLVTVSGPDDLVARAQLLLQTTDPLRVERFGAPEGEETEEESPGSA
jgi:outer membrane lipoprotein SlyB